MAQEPWAKSACEKAEKQIVARFGEGERARASQGLAQVSALWRAEDGDAAAFERFATEQFAGTKAARDTMFERFQRLLEKLDGHLGEIGREFRTQSDLDLGPIQPYDEIFAGYDPGAHVADDFFGNKLAFVVLLNFPLTTLDQRLAEGATWSRRQWAETRLAQRFSKRIPAPVQQTIAEARAEADQYIADYNIYMHNLVESSGNRLFPKGMRLLSHWNLRDEIKANYADKDQGLNRQRMIQQVMERIVTQTIPKAAVNSPLVDWDPFANTVVPSTAGEGAPPAKVSADPEPDTRYAVLLKTFTASRQADPYSPSNPTLIARSFNEGRELPEARVKAMLEAVVSSPHARTIAALIEKRLGRPLEPFDIWYNGFRPPSPYSEAELDKITRRKYPNPEAFRRDIPVMLDKLGFSPSRSAYLAKLIAVDPARGSGHASGAAMRGVEVRLRTRVGPEGMNYKGFNIAVHEMGHNVEQVLSLNAIDYPVLQGVPNTAFTEGIAFVFQARDLELLGLQKPQARAEARNLVTINDFWSAYEISGVALVDMAIWHWMYDHPSATPAQLKEAVLSIAKQVWNAYYAPVFGKKDVVLLAVYSHIIHSFLYIPDYPMGQMIAFQIERHIEKAGSLGPEVERMVVQGNISPDLWMKGATGSPVGPEALLEATAEALKKF
jgi:hypothetical protein